MRNYDERPAVSLYLVGQHKLEEGNPAFTVLCSWVRKKNVTLTLADIVEITGNEYDRFYHMHSTQEICDALVSGNCDFAVREYIRSASKIGLERR